MVRLELTHQEIAMWIDMLEYELEILQTTHALMKVKIDTIEELEKKLLAPIQLENSNLN